jgi:citrate lyase beta subunit
MKHHRHKPDFPFVHPPREFDKYTDKSFLQYCLGGALYMPGTRQIADKLISRSMLDMTSMVMDFEDAVDAEHVGEAEDSVLNQLDLIDQALENQTLPLSELPLIFIRVRNVEQFQKFTQKFELKHATSITGFVFPKVSHQNAQEYFLILRSLNERLDVQLYGMPILEGESIAHKETRTDQLRTLKIIFKPYMDLILNVRVGATDFSSIFGVRRGINYSIYDILPVRDCLADILNFFNRSSDGFVVSAPVWEYFLAHKEDNIAEILEGPLHRSLINRSPILNEAIDGLLREVILDKANGFVGKTTIHPSHLRYVNAMQAVTREEFEDAQQILETSGGVVKSSRANKMNEINPHRNWAVRISMLADAYGVIEDESAYLSLAFS